MPAMPKDIRQVAGIVTKLVRLENTESGNPRWMVYLNRRLFWVTKRDTAVALVINEDVLDKPVMLTLENNLIVDIEELGIHG